MNQKRIRKALDHIENLIHEAERDDAIDRSHVQPAREAHAYLKFALEGLKDIADKASEIRGAADEIDSYALRIENAMKSEPPRCGLSLS